MFLRTEVLKIAQMPEVPENRKARKIEDSRI
jgi:hypothetical protein